MQKYDVRILFNVQEIVEYPEIVADSEKSAIRKALEQVFYDGYYTEDMIVDITVKEV